MNATCCPRPPRLLVIPGLHGSPAGHWQSWLERRWRSSRRVEQHDWARADLHAWSDRIGEVLAAEPPGPWIAIAHSYGCLALLQHVLDECPRGGATLAAALLVAPADPARFGTQALLRRRVPLPRATVLASSNDPWLPTHAALPWAHAWGLPLVDLGEAGHVNVASGHGPWPWLLQQVERQRQCWHAARHAQDSGLEPAGAAA